MKPDTRYGWMVRVGMALPIAAAALALVSCGGVKEYNGNVVDIQEKLDTGIINIDTDNDGFTDRSLVVGLTSNLAKQKNDRPMYYRAKEMLNQGMVPAITFNEMIISVKAQKSR